MPKIVVVYLSTSGNTKAMADAIAEGLTSSDAKVIMFDAATSDSACTNVPPTCGRRCAGSAFRNGISRSRSF